MSTEISSPPALPAEIAKVIEGKPDVAQASTQLSIYRTRLSVYRTHVSNLRSHLANERTHLAYLRTAISLVGFGITLNKFSVWLIQQDKAEVSSKALRDTSWVGSGMVVLGLALLAWSLLRFWMVSRDIENGVYVARYRTTVIATLGLLLIGGSTALWLFFD
ncbi:YidH family protein [Lysobacter niabensis]|uniref:YidH family protein n=1 Tax=Agrilutibacter niabensis TaxID=380628 RepID=UPI0036228219